MPSTGMKHERELSEQIMAFSFITEEQKMLEIKYKIKYKICK